jgi:hypothetical protein
MKVITRIFKDQYENIIEIVILFMPSLACAIYMMSFMICHFIISIWNKLNLLYYRWLQMLLS